MLTKINRTSGSKAEDLEKFAAKKDELERARLAEEALARTPKYVSLYCRASRQLLTNHF